MGKSTVNESDPHFAGLYCGVSSSNPALKAQIESHDAVLHLGPFNVSGNTGGFSAELPTDKLIELHPAYCSVGGKVWEGLDFRPVVEKLLVRLTKEPIQRTVDLAKILPKTSEVCHLAAMLVVTSTDFHNSNHPMTIALTPLTMPASGTVSPNFYAPMTS